MKRLAPFICFLVAGLIAGCGPAITVENKTDIPVRAIVTSGGKSQVLSPSPGESSIADAEEGAYRVAVIPDAEWIEYAKLTRKVLNEQVAQADSLTGPQLLEVVRRLKDIAVRMKEFENAAGSQAGCAGSISSDGGGLVTVSTGNNGALVVRCN
jgi:hypothetical protein